MRSIMTTYKVTISRVTPNRYSVTYKDKVIVKASSDPEYAACRCFFNQGLDGVVETYWKDKLTPAMRLYISKCAPLTVLDTDKQGLRTVKWS